VYLRDKRDQPIDPRKGNNTTFDLSWASRYFASEADFTRILIQNSTYHAIGKGDRFLRAPRGLAWRDLCTTRFCPMPRYSRPKTMSSFRFRKDCLRGAQIRIADSRLIRPVRGILVPGSRREDRRCFSIALSLRLPPVNWPYVGDNLSFAIFNDMGNVFDTAADT